MEDSRCGSGLSITVYWNVRVIEGKDLYWFASDSKDEQLDMLLVSFDYTTERFGRLSLPCNCPLDCFRNAAISVVSEEKLAVLLLRKNTWEKEIWISNKIDGTKEVSWRKFVTVDYPKDDVWISITRFLLNEEKKVALCCETCVSDRFTTMMKKLIYIAGEDHKVKIMASGEVTSGSFWPIVLDFVPSLVQIPASGCNRKNRGD
ncbi:probable F-box protein At5g47300 [Brassica napus]|uniref:probable F-box protein At5g47300 n=1 Tax=Brassica napus TaxID=3708 RepID=UPI0006AA8897|nr:probable F-box protein At5g47300 [Brassica napus]